MTARESLFDSGKLKVEEAPSALARDLKDGLRLGVIGILVMLGAAFFLSGIVGPLFALGNVEETVMDVLTRLALLALPFVAYIAAASVARRYTAADTGRALGLAFTTTIILFAAISAGHYAFSYGAFAPRPSLQMTLSQTEAGIRVESIVPGGAADIAEMQVGDVITAIRRDKVDLAAFNRRVGQSEEDAPLRLRFIRGAEEMQETARVVLASDKQLSVLLPGLLFGLAFTAIIVFLPGHQASPRRGANRRRTDSVGKPDTALGELPQMRRAHRNIGVHLDPLRPLLIRLDKKYVGTFVQHARSPFLFTITLLYQTSQYGTEWQILHPPKPLHKYLPAQQQSPSNRADTPHNHRNIFQR